MLELFKHLKQLYIEWLDRPVNKYIKHVFGVVVLSVICALIFHMVYIEITQQTVMTDESLHDNITQSELLEAKLSSYQHLIMAMANNITKYVTDQGDAAEISSVLNDFSSLGYFDDIRYVDHSGKCVLTNGQQVDYGTNQIYSDLSKYDYSTGARVFLEENVRGDYSISIAQPVKNKTGMSRGYVIAKVAWDKEKIIEELASELNYDDAFFVIDKLGRVLLQSDKMVGGYDFSDLRNLYTYLNGFDIYGDFPKLRDLAKENDDGCVELNTKQGIYTIYYSRLDQLNDDEFLFITLQKKPNFYRLIISMEDSDRNLVICDLLLVLLLAILLSLITYRSEVRLDTIAFKDNITAARTKTYLRIEAQKLLASDDKDKERRMLIVIDIIGFRHVNELYGRERGDELLQMLAEKLLVNLGKKEVLARNTADLFEMFVYYQPDWKRRLATVSSEIKSFAKSIDIAVPVKLRAGAVRVTKDDKEFSLLLDKANSARKSIGISTEDVMVMYNNQLAEEMLLREEIEASQESALAHDEFKLFLQPKFDLRTGKVSGAEALVRWIKIDGKMVFPDKFIPVFEQNSFIEKLDFHMLEMALALQKRLVDEGVYPVPISVNQSRILMLRPGYVDRVKALYGSYEFDNSLVEIEITETVFAEDKETIINVIKELHEHGCIIDMDDFGSGYSSLNTLREMPFDVLKIDREFFGGSVEGNGRKILEHVVSMAQDLGMKTVCEGVETVDDEAILKEMGCDYGQGYLYSRPIPAEEFLEKFIYNRDE